MVERFSLNVELNLGINMLFSAVIYILAISGLVECNTIIDHVNEEDKRFILDEIGSKYSSIEQFTACGFDCIPAYPGGDLERCCITGDSAVCQAIAWDTYRSFLGACTTKVPAHTTVAQTHKTASTQVTATSTMSHQTGTCADDSNCQTLVQSFQASGENLCFVDGLKHFCNRTCNLCPGATTPAPIVTSIVDHCARIQCSHGHCVDIGSIGICQCDAGYVGEHCDIHDPCSVHPCVHGTCVPLSTGSFRCACEDGYIGFICSIDDPCKPDPCVHGQCQIHNNNAQCTCERGYVGYFCDRDDPCAFNPCVHGTCTSNLYGAVMCTCDAGYSGVICEHGP
ncbi:hypothetical protein ACF0H5_017112 [Mactra antiquata]